MTVAAHAPGHPASRRRGYRQEVERLLDEIQQQVFDLRRLKTAGMTSRALAARKQRLEHTRRQLASLVSRRSQPA